MATLTSEGTTTLKRKAEEEEDASNGSSETDQKKTYKPIIMERKDDGTPMKKRRRKNVSFNGVTVYYFPRSQGFTSVPSQGGATLGMSSKHETLQELTLTEFARLQDSDHRTALKKQLLQRRRDQLIQNNCDFQEATLQEDVEEEINQITISDYYFLQPVPTKQRRNLLRTAGVRKIDRTEKLELKRIRLSRESCGCDCVGYCDPQTCQCSLAGIKCQVDRMSFPCGCTKDYCKNGFGRIEFNPIKVREHFITTMKNIDWEDYGSENDSSTEISSPERDGQFAGQTGLESLDSSQSSFSSSSYVFSNSLSKGLQSDSFHTDHFQHYPQSSLQPPPLGYTGVSSEGDIPIRIESCQSLANYGPQKLHFNDSDDIPIEGGSDIREFPCNLGLPSTPSYDSSEDSLSSSSDTSSTSGGENPLQESNPFYFGNAQDFTQPSQDYLHEEHANQESLLPSKDDPDQSGKTYTELTQSSALQSFGLSQFPSISQDIECHGLPPMGSIFQSLAKSRQEPAVTLGMLTDGSSAMTGGISHHLYSTYSPSMTAHSFEEMKETALATNSISCVPSGMFSVQGMNHDMNGQQVAPSGSSVQDTSLWQKQYFAVDQSLESVDLSNKENSPIDEIDDVNKSSIPELVEGAEIQGSPSNHEEVGSLDDSEEVEHDAKSKLSEEDRDSSDSSSDSAVFSGTEEQCASSEIEEGTHPIVFDSSNDSGLGVSQSSNTPMSEGVVAECNEDSFIEASTDLSEPALFKPMTTTLPILEQAVAE